MGDQPAAEHHRRHDDVPERASGAQLAPDARESFPEVGEPLSHGVGADALQRAGGLACGDQIAVVRVARQRDHAVGGGRADAALGRADGATERLRVGGVGQQRQVRERVADLGALVQAEAAEHPVRDTVPGERGLHRPGRITGAREHQHLARRDAAGERLRDRCRDTVGLVAV